jgi:tetratricopeptide (TPR) repeat protein
MIRAALFRLSGVAALLTLSLAPALAQQTPAADMGRIHGRVINPAGLPQNNGTVSLSTDGGVILTYTFAVSAAGEYSGEAPPAEYTVVYRAPDTPEGKIVDSISGVEIVAGRDTTQDIDMTRPAFIDRLTPEQQKQLQAMREANAATMIADPDIVAINADLKVVNQDFLDAENARAAVTRNLGATASNADVDDMTAEIRNAKYSEIETLMTKDVAVNPAEPVLWLHLARAQMGLKNYLDAETNYKKALELGSKTGRPEPEIVGAANAGLGEVYARTLMVDEANAAFDAAARADPAMAATYLTNQAIIFFQEKNVPAQVDAADEAIKADPNEAILYFIKAEGLAEKAAVDPTTNQILLPPDCAAAFRKYLELAPNGEFAAVVTGILQRAEK